MKATTAPLSTEHIYFCCIYGPERRGRALLPDVFRRLGAHVQGDAWYYTNAVQRKVYIIHLADTPEKMIQAFYTEDAHIVVNGHSNYGLGTAFASGMEQYRQAIPNIHYADDERFLGYSSPWVSINVPKLLARQSYPNWWPVYRDGTSAVMPYDFSDPHRDPAYNYYLTYEVPGDPTRYKIEPVPNSALQRFPDSGFPAWYAADGSAPNSKNPQDRKYFIINTNEFFQSTGKWHTGVSPEGFYGSNYLSSTTGTGTNQAKWNFSISTPGTYVVSAQWPLLPTNVTNAQYVVTHAQGTTTVSANQRANGGCWVALGTFTFDAGNYSVLLSDKAAAAGVTIVADAIRISASTNTSSSDQIIDNLASPKPHFGKKTVIAAGHSRLDPTKFRYKRLFYEGCLSGIYYLDVFHRGTAFYTLGDSYLSVFETYLREYLRGANDEQIWAAIQELEPVFDYYDFSLPPGKQRAARVWEERQVEDIGPADRARIDRIAAGSAERIFEALRQPELVHNEALARAVARAAFGGRTQAGIYMATQQMSVPLIEKTDEGRQSKIRSLVAAKRIFEVLPQQSVPALLDLYAHSDPLTRGNIIRASGGIADSRIRKLLEDALADATVCEGPDWNSGGAPMRLCDEAYNQLVAHGHIGGLMHTIAPPLPSETRQYHIAELKKRLPELKD